MTTPTPKAAAGGSSVNMDKAGQQLADLVMTCAYAVISGAKTVTVSRRGKRPVGFPVGELLSIGTNGSENYAVDPVKALAWVHARMTQKNA